MDTTKKTMTEDEIRVMLDSVSAKLEEKGARQMEVLNVHDQTTLADYFIICTGTSNTHIRTLSQEVEHHMETEFGLRPHHMEQTYGLRPHHIEGYDNAQWVLVDYGFLVVHIFRADVREFYSLERLWR